MGTGFIRGYGAAIGRMVIAIGSLVTLAAAVLAFILSGSFGTEFRETIEGKSDVPMTFRLDLRDHVSGQMVSVPVPGEYL